MMLFRSYYKFFLWSLEKKLGAAGEAVSDLIERGSWKLGAEKFGFLDWIHFDASIVRGLAYYNGIMFEGFDREGKLRANNCIVTF